MIFFKNYFEKNLSTRGDYFEFGVYQGSSLISVAILFKELNIKKKFMVLIVLKDFRVIIKMMILKILVKCIEINLLQNLITKILNF